MNSTCFAINQLALEYEQAYFNTFPELALFWGKSDPILDRFTDNSIEAICAWQAKEDIFFNKLQEINAVEVKGQPEYITYQLLFHTLESARAQRICKEQLWQVDPMWGWCNRLAILAGKQPVDGEHYRELALKRWRTFDNVANTEIANLRQGLKEGYTAPKPAVERVLQQLDIMLSMAVEDSPFFELAKGNQNSEFRQQIVTLIKTVINTALKKYADFLASDYLPHARTQIGISALPQGNACYQAKILQQTTLAIAPEEIYAYGLKHMQLIEREVQSIGANRFGSTNIAEIFQRAKKQSEGYFESEQAILDYNHAALQRALAQVPQWFDKLPNIPGTLKPYPLHRAQTGAPGEYHPPNEDGTRPGIFYINTFQPNKKSRLDQEATLFHELIPGHHFQIALAMEDKSHLSLDKYLHNAGFCEGWALYVERLADEMGLYQDDISRLGMLANEALRTARLVVDPGIHVKNWTREQAVEYMKQHCALEDHIIENEVDRYIMLAGQATSYMLGKREIVNLRELAQITLKNNFDIREFHNQVLKNGTVTLPMLRAHIEEWLATS